MNTTHTLQLQKPINRKSFQTLTTSNGIYLFKKNNTYVYIGKSNNIKSRILSHWENAKNIPKEKAIFENSNRLECISVDSEFNALILEASLIQKYRPIYNVIWKDGKSYLYIKITIKDEYPKLFAVRKESQSNSLYFGPFSSSKDVEILIRSLRKIYPFCTQKKITSRACFYNKIGQCNPCPNIIHNIQDTAEKNRQKKLYKRNITSIIKILKGNTDLMLHDMYQKLKVSSKNEDYETALKLRNAITNLEFLVHYRKFSQDPYIPHVQNNIVQIRSILHPYFPEIKKLTRIECYDISNLSQKQATASMVVATNGIIDKSQYRKFKIKSTEIYSDFEMLHETVNRRFKHSWPQPDLIIIDGGRPQVSTVLKSLTQLHIKIPIIGIAKNPDRLVIGDKFLSTFKPNIHHYGFNFIRLMRDESHRFAKKYHLFLRERKIV